jgi:hypothetical protein
MPSSTATTNGMPQLAHMGAAISRNFSKQLVQKLPSAATWLRHEEQHGG